MKPFGTLAALFCLVSVTAATMQIRSIADLNKARNSREKHLVIGNIKVPAGQTLDFQGFNGSTIEFTGRVTFGYKEFSGHLIIIKGANIKVYGKPGHLIDGEGHRWWDTHGGNGGKKKPHFIYVQLEKSIVKGLKIKNSPAWVFALNACYNLQMSQIDIDNNDGHRKGGHNTDGFDIAKSRNVRITDSRVNNQDDCLAINSGTDIVFQNNECIGGHGIAVAVGGYDYNEAHNILIKNCKVIKNNIGIRVKTHLQGKGIVKGVTFDNIILKDISEIGIVVIGNYLNSGPKGEPNGKIPIHNLNINNVRGNVLANGTNHLVYVAPGSGKGWIWKSNVRGGRKLRPCKGIPNGIKVECGK